MDDAILQKVLETVQESCTNYREYGYDCCDCILCDPDSEYCTLDIDELGGVPFYWDLDKFFDRMGMK